MNISAVMFSARIQNFVDNDDSSTVQVPAVSVKSLAEVTAALDLKVTRMLNITPEFNNEGPISVRLSLYSKSLLAMRLSNFSV